MVAPQQQQLPQASRMSLGAVVKGRQKAPEKIVLYGPEGVGKSTFGAAMPKPIFLAAEDGTKHLDVARFPLPETWQDVLDAVRVLSTDNHEYQTLVFDTADWIEPLLWDFISKRDGKTNIEDYGYGKGYQVAVDGWRLLVSELERLRRVRRMHILVLAHARVQPFKNPEGEDYDRYELKVHKHAGGVLKEWSDHVLFANHEIAAKQDKRTKRVRGVTTNARFLYTMRHAAYDAKSRAALPEQLPLSWPDFAAALEKAQPADPAVVKAEIERKAKQLGGDLEKKALAALTTAGEDGSKLSHLNGWCNSHIAFREAEQQKNPTQTTQQ